MQPIVAPIKPNDRGPQVANLIEGLLFVERGVFKTYDAPSRPTLEELKDLAAKAKQELATQFFGEVSQGLVLDFQLLQGFTAEGAINAAQQSCLSNAAQQSCLSK